MPFLAEKKEFKKIEKLVTTFENKKNYVCHIRNLKQALENGLKLEKIHKVVSFYQEAFMKKYIDFNTEKRAQSKSEFHKALFKLMNNSVFGKTMENVKNRVNL